MHIFTACIFTYNIKNAHLLLLIFNNILYLHWTWELFICFFTVSTCWWKTHWLLEVLRVTVLIHAKATAVLLTIEFATLVYKWAQWKKQITFYSYYEVSFDVRDLLKAPWGPHTSPGTALGKLLFYEVISIWFHFL